MDGATGEPQVGARLSVVGFGKMRKDGTRGSKVKLALETQGTSAVRVRVHAPREAAVLDTRFRLVRWGLWDGDEDLSLTTGSRFRPPI